MISELARELRAVALEKNLAPDVLQDVLQQSMVAAAKKRYGRDNFEAYWNDDFGRVDLYEFKLVVDDDILPEEAGFKISLAEARTLPKGDASEPDSEVGDSVGIPVPVGDLGRIAAQSAKQTIIQKLREAEREQTFSEFKDRKGEIVTGIVRRFERGSILVELGRAEAILPKNQQVLTETYRQGDRIQAYVMEINRAAKQPQIVLSRSHPSLLMKLFEIEVPEVAEGIVRIEAAAREPGFRAKIAVRSTDPDVDPVGACVGMKGSRVQAVVSELRGEAIDIVPWHDDPARLVTNALAPAQVSKVFVYEDRHAMQIIVADDQLSKAIGRRGQNVRLAAQLTGWSIDIESRSKHEEMEHAARAELSRIPGLIDDQIEALIDNRMRTLSAVSDAEAWEIAQALGIEDEEAERLILAAEKALDELILEERERQKNAEVLPPSAD